MKRIISLLLTALMAFSVLTVGAASVSAVGETVPAGTEIYFDNSNTGWKEVYFYAWANQFFGDTYKLSPVDEEHPNLYKMVLPVETPVSEPFFLFKSEEGWGETCQQTTDLAVYANYNTYTPVVDEETGKVVIVEGKIVVNETCSEITPGPDVLGTPSSKEFIDVLPVKLYAFRATNAKYTINGGDPVAFTDVASFIIDETSTITVYADNVTPQTYTYTKVENATVNVYVDGYTKDDNVYMYTFGGDRVGSEFVLMTNLGEGFYTATINGSAQVIFTTADNWSSTTQKFIISENGVVLADQEPLVSAGTTRDFNLTLPVTPTTPAE